MKKLRQILLLTNRYCCSVMLLVCVLASCQQNARDGTEGKELQAVNELKVPDIALYDSLQLSPESEQSTRANAWGLEGIRKLHLQWIKEPGMLSILPNPDKEGAFSVKGGVVAASGSDYLYIEGLLEPSPEGQLLFWGSIESRVSFLNEGQKCIKSSSTNQPLRFLRKGRRPFFRLQEMANCGGMNQNDFIDIYLNPSASLGGAMQAGR